MSYEAFVAGKLSRVPPTGLATIPPLNETLFPFQRDLVTWALRRGRCAIFADTGLGKTRQELEWARCVAQSTGGRVLILAPLAVGAQTVREAERVGIEAKQIRYAADLEDAPSIVITNYDRIHHFAEVIAAGAFVGVVCDESSVIKNSDSKTFATLTELFAATPFRLCATATPSPNDYTELGTHAEFLGICTKEEMLAEYFCHDGGETQTWRLKGHARGAFWRWVAGWAALIRKPSDFGYDDSAYVLPPLTIEQHTIKMASDGPIVNEKNQALLFAEPAKSLTERRAARKASMNPRVESLVKLITEDCDRCRGSQSTTIEDERGRSRIQSIAPNATLSPEIPSAIGREASNITETIQRDSSSTPSNVQRKTDDAERDMLLTSSSEATTNPRSKITSSETHASGSLSGSRNSASHQTTSIASSPLKEADVRSADANATSTRTVASTSITATAPAASAESSALHAISDSASSATTPIASRWPQGTCGCAKREQWLVWVELNVEEELIADALGCEAIAIRGSDTSERKEAAAMAWMRGDVRILISKPSIFGWGLNFQHCARMCFVGVKDSYESTYQAIRRCWRFGQTRPVHVHVFAGDLEGEVVKNLERKERDALAMAEALSAETREVVRAEILGQKRQTNDYKADTRARVPTWM